MAFAAILSFPRVTQAASVLDFQHETPEEILLAQRAISDSIVPPPPDPGQAVLSAAEPAPEKRRSTGAAFLMNLAIPGVGHLYAGHKRGFVNLGLEAFAWAAYLYYHDRGKTKEKEFEGYADQHWSYQAWIDSCQCSGSPEDSLILRFRDTNRQQYYEDIGKISTYWDGWDSQDNRNFYRGIRAHSNNFLKNANYAVAGAFVNRVVSAVDILRLMKRQTRAVLGKDAQLRFRVRTKPFARENAVGLEITKRL
ncbi:MAG: hypothetical protein HY568_06835 [Candidatus Latescibacteria bacterium]|nr:hypothetical protein [Candidatus Latescibacterota bacterium]